MVVFAVDLEHHLVLDPEVHPEVEVDHYQGVLRYHVQDRLHDQDREHHRAEAGPDQNPDHIQGLKVGPLDQGKFWRSLLRVIQ